jgi:hypothetical protein
MASRFLTRSKAIAHALARADAVASPQLAGARSLRALSTLPQDPAAATPLPRQPSARSPLDLSKVCSPAFSFIPSFPLDVGLFPRAVTVDQIYNSAL